MRTINDLSEDQWKVLDASQIHISLDEPGRIAELRLALEDIVKTAAIGPEGHEVAIVIAANALEKDDRSIT